MPTREGPVWFKASVPVAAHDGPVSRALARIRPDLVLDPIALDRDRGWLLLPDGGETLRRWIERERDPRRWVELAPLYAELQIAAAPHAEELLALGLPDQRLARLPSLAGELGVEEVAPLCAQLASYGIPETVQHDDFHDGNVFVSDGGYRIFDWGDSCASHPFFSLVVCLRSIAYRFELGEDDPDLERIRDAYLEPWTSHTARERLLEAWPLARRLGMLCRALTWRRIGQGIPRAFREEYDHNREVWLEWFLDG